MKKLFIFLLAIFSISNSNIYSQNTKTFPERPKLIVGIVVDQMRYDYLYRFLGKYGEGGFKRLLNDGFSCENTMLNYIPSVTAIGHTTIFTGSVPSIHGIAGNDWVNPRNGKLIYCTTDSTVKTVGNTTGGQMSPRNLWTTTITDELRLATNFRSKVVGVSLKDRAAILPAGHNPTAAFWLDDVSGKFISSTYYLKTLPDWVNRFNDKKPIAELIANGWNTLLPIDQYNESTDDNVIWEDTLAGALKPAFPYDTKKAYALNHGSLRQMPFGNTLTLQFAQAAVDGYKLGQESTCDFLTINCASTDYCGHLVGPNAIEVEDIYLRLDKDLATFFAYLDKNIGKGKYLVFLTADHGAAQAKGFLAEHNMPTGLFRSDFKTGLDNELSGQYGAKGLVYTVDNFQVYFNRDRIDSLKLDFDKIKETSIKYLKKQDGVQYVVDQEKIAVASIPQVLKEKMINGFNPERSGSVVLIPKSGWLPSYSKQGTAHSLWNPYDTHIPLLFMGWNIKHGSTNENVDMTDISATIAAMLHIQMPSGCIGKPIIPVIK